MHSPTDSASLYVRVDGQCHDLERAVQPVGALVPRSQNTRHKIVPPLARPARIAVTETEKPISSASHYTAKALPLPVPLQRLQEASGIRIRLGVRRTSKRGRIDATQMGL